MDSKIWAILSLSSRRLSRVISGDPTGESSGSSGTSFARVPTVPARLFSVAHTNKHHKWAASVDLGPYADGLDQYTFPTNGMRDR